MEQLNPKYAIVMQYILTEQEFKDLQAQPLATNMAYNRLSEAIYVVNNLHNASTKADMLHLLVDGLNMAEQDGNVILFLDGFIKQFNS